MTIPTDKLARARQLVAGGWSIQGTAVHLGVNYSKLYAALGDLIRERIAREKVEFARRLAAIPPDTRSLTGRLLGDPLPGRSALDRERRHCPTPEPTKETAHG